jgi:hypothetical protein
MRRVLRRSFLGASLVVLCVVGLMNDFVMPPSSTVLAVRPYAPCTSLPGPC